MSNPEIILSTLDRHLRHPVELTLYGRAALMLGFPSPLPEHATTKDVDAILPLAQIEVLNAESWFWDAQEATNEELRPRGLYITHLFSEADVFLRPDWLAHRVKIDRRFAKLTLYRPATIDLILTKMMRDDPSDLADIEFLLSQEPASLAELKAALDIVRLPDLDEYRHILERVRPKVLALFNRKPRPEDSPEAGDSA